MKSLGFRGGWIVAIALAVFLLLDLLGPCKKPAYHKENKQIVNQTVTQVAQREADHKKYADSVGVVVTQLRDSISELKHDREVLKSDLAGAKVFAQRTIAKIKQGFSDSLDHSTTNDSTKSYCLDLADQFSGYIVKTSKEIAQSDSIAAKQERENSLISALLARSDDENIQLRKDVNVIAGAFKSEHTDNLKNIRMLKWGRVKEKGLVVIAAALLTKIVIDSFKK